MVVGFVVVGLVIILNVCSNVDISCFGWLIWF